MKGYLYLLCICVLCLSCAQNKLTDSDLEKLFPDIKNPTLLSKKYYNWGDDKESKITNIIGDFNHDNLEDIALIGQGYDTMYPDSTFYFFAIISLEESDLPQVQFFTKLLEINEYVSLLNFSNKFLCLGLGTWGGIDIKWVNDHYETELFTDGPIEDESLLIHFIEFPKKPSVLIYLSKDKDNQLTEWSGYAPSHKKDGEWWTYFTKYDSTKVVLSPDVCYNWDDTFSYYHEIKLLLVTDGPNIDSLAEIYWGADNTESIEEIMNKIGKENILKIWDIKKLTPNSDDWYLSYP